MTDSLPAARVSALRLQIGRWWVALAACAQLLIGSGCVVHGGPRHRPVSPPEMAAFVPVNHVQADVIPASIRRVAVLPLHASDWRGDEVASIDEALRAALGRSERFEIAPISRAELSAHYGSESLGSSSALPADLLPRLRADRGVDAVLLLDLTQFSPYQPLAIGVRAKLVATDDGASLWSFDSVFDTSRSDVSLAARRFSTGDKRPGSASEDQTAVLQSPARFARYVGYAMFETLPPRRTE